MGRDDASLLGVRIRHRHLATANALLAGLTLKMPVEGVESGKRLLAAEADVRPFTGVEGRVSLAVVLAGEA